MMPSAIQKQNILLALFQKEFKMPDKADNGNNNNHINNKEFIEFFSETQSTL